MERHDEDITNASGTEISRNIAKLAERRTDIFGVGEKGAEQTIIGKKLGEEERTMPRSDPKTIWDGQQSTIDATTRAAAQQQMSIDQQIQEIQRQHGFQSDLTKERIGPKGVVFDIVQMPTLDSTPTIKLPPPTTVGGSIAKVISMPVNPSGIPPIMPPMGMSNIPIIPQIVVPNNPFHPPSSHSTALFGIQPSLEDGPPNKRLRPEDNLESEAEWLKKVNGTININIPTPMTQEWDLNGKTYQILTDITSSVI